MRRSLLLPLLFLCSLPLTACGYYVLGEQYRIALLDPDLLGPDYAPFFYSTQKFNTLTNAQAGSDRLRNAADWAAELGGRVTRDDVMELLYRTPFADYVAVREGNRGLALASNPAWRALEKRPAVLDYLMWAKAYEKPNADRYGWWERPEAEPAELDAYRQNMRARAVTGRAAAKRGSWLYRRWTYQLFLLDRYAGNEEGMEMNYLLLREGDRDHVLSDWARFHMAPYWNKPGLTEVEYARAFRVTPEKALAVYQRVGKDFDPAAALPAARNNRDRSDLYALAAVRRRGRALSDIRQVYRYNRTNPLLDLLLVREINKLEDWLLSHRLTGLGPALPSRALTEAETQALELADYERVRDQVRRENAVRDRAYLKEVRSFLREARPDDDSRSRWRLFRAQLALLDEDYATAAGLAEPLRSSDDERLVAAAARVEFLALVQSGQLGTADVDDRIAGFLAAIPEEEPDAADYSPRPTETAVLHQLTSQAYAAAGDTVAAYLLQLRARDLVTSAGWASAYYQSIDYLDRPVSLSVIDAVIERLTTEQPTGRFASYLRNGPVPTAELADRVRDLGGTLALRANDPARALAYFTAVRTAYADFPFTAYFRQPEGRKVALTRRLVELDRRAAATGEARDLLDLAAAWFDLGYYGDHWMMLSYGRSAYVPARPLPYPAASVHAAVPHTEATYELTFGNRRARDLYRQARAAAVHPDLRAEADFHLLNIERLNQRQDLLRGKYLLWEEEFSLLDGLYRATFDGYREEYGETEFFRGMVQQCGWFAARYDD